MGKKRDIIRLEKELVIPIIKRNLVAVLSDSIEQGHVRDSFLQLCQRVEYAVRAWYLLQFEDMLALYSLFEPIHGAGKLMQQGLSPEEIDILEQKFLTYLFQIMDKSNFKISTDDEIEIALSSQYRLNLPIIVDESKLDNRFLARYFAKHPQEKKSSFYDKFIIFRRGFGIDHMAGFFFKQKINAIVARAWRIFLKVTGMKWILRGSTSNRNKYDPKPNRDIVVTDTDGLYVERIRIEKMKLSNFDLLKRVTIQEPTFERIVVIYRRTNLNNEFDRNIHLKHFRNVPMADMEIVLPEKKNPGLNPIDWVKFLISAAIGLTTIISSLSIPKADIRVMLAILTSVAGYCIKTYFSYQRKLIAYQSLITSSVYDKQLDSGRGTLLHLCDEVVQQEVKEVVVAFFVLMMQGEATTKELDQRCEELIEAQFGENCNFDVDDAVGKLDKLGIVSQDTNGRYSFIGLSEANDVIGMTTEEIVRRAKLANK